MQFTLNGQPETLDSATTLGQLLSRLELEPIRVAVEINEGLIPRRSFAQTPICDGDRVEIVTLVGGG